MLYQKKIWKKVLFCISNFYEPLHNTNEKLISWKMKFGEISNRPFSMSLKGFQGSNTNKLKL